jgi:hypothetical protein
LKKASESSCPNNLALGLEINKEHRVEKSSNESLDAKQLRRLNDILRKENASLKKTLGSSLTAKNELTSAIKNCIMEVFSLSPDQT